MLITATLVIMSRIKMELGHYASIVFSTPTLHISKNILSLGLLFALVAFVGCSAYTPLIRDNNGTVISGSIASLEEVPVGGVKQWILIRGNNTTSPMLLFLHGGPGMPIMYYAYTFQKPLEEDFVVVQWDRRGAGKSYDSEIDVESMNVEQIIADTHELVQMLRRRFRTDKVYLVGHSWGSYLGMILIQRYPELFHAYVGVGQLAYSGERNWEVQERFIRQRATETTNTVALADLDTRGPRSYEKWLFEFGAELYRATSIWPFIRDGLFAPEYSIFDAFKISSGSQFNQQYMKYNAINGQLIDVVSSVQVPVYFFAGRHDYTTPYELTEEYFQKLSAPQKKMVWFLESAHFPFYEEPEKFSREMKLMLDETSVKKK